MYQNYRKGGEMNKFELIEKLEERKLEDILGIGGEE